MQSATGATPKNPADSRGGSRSCTRRTGSTKSTRWFSFEAARTTAVGALALFAVACQLGPTGPVVVLETPSGDVPVKVEFALTPQEQSRGLMWRTDLPEDTGMLFVFPNETERSFWMKNTPSPLDILYIAADGTIVHIAEHTTPYSRQAIPSHHPAKYVLEVNAGHSARHGVKAGHKARLPEIPAPGTPAASPKLR